MDYKIIRMRSLIFLFGFFLMASVAYTQPPEDLDAPEIENFAIAEKGDGIYSLLRKHGIDPYQYHDAFVTLNMDSLQDSLTLKVGNKYYLPDVIRTINDGTDTITVADLKKDSTMVPKVEVEPKSVTGITYAIFGKEHAEVDIKSNRLAKTVYYLISGHGGPDPGAMTRYLGKEIAEDEYAYDVTLRLAKELLSHGAQVYVIIRDPNDGIRDERILEIDHDEVNYPSETIPLSQKERLRQRTESVNKLYAKHKGKYQRLIVTHVDSRSKGQNIDVFFYHHEKSKNGRKLAESIHKTFQQKYKKYQPNREYNGTFEDRTGLYLVKKTHPPMTFIEIGNISNKKDQRRILDPDNRQALAKWISEGVLLDYED